MKEEYNILIKNSKSTITDKLIDKKFEMKDKIEKLEKKINNIENGNDKIEYYLDTLDLISKYYNKLSIN